MRLLLADDHKIVRDGLKSCLAGNPAFQVVGEACDGHQAVELATRLCPDIVIMDIAMPGLNGIEATRKITAGTHCQPKVVILSMHADREFVAEALRAGAAGFLLKVSAFEELVTALHTVAGGRKYLTPHVTDVLVDNLVAPTKLSQTPGAFALLTNREREVLQLLAEGHSTKQIAFKLAISDKTVHTFRAKIMHKLKLDSVADLTKYAIREGLTSLDH